MLLMNKNGYLNAISKINATKNSPKSIYWLSYAKKDSLQLSFNTDESQEKNMYALPWGFLLHV